MELLREIDSLASSGTSWDKDSEAALDRIEVRAGRVASFTLASLRWAVAAESLARVCLAVRVQRDVTGDWPDDLSALADYSPDGVPVDPYTGRPFVIERDGETRVIRASPPDEGALSWPYETPRKAGLVWRLSER